MTYKYVLVCLILAACAPQVGGSVPSPAANRSVPQQSVTPNPTSMSVGVQELTPLSKKEAAVSSEVLADAAQDTESMPAAKAAQPAKPVANTPRAATHVVAPGETVYSLARRYNTTPKQLIEENQLSAPYGLNVGQKISIPAAVMSKPEKILDKETRDETAPIPLQQQGAAVSGNALQRQAHLPRPRDKKGALFAWPVRGTIVVDYGETGKGQRSDGINIAAARGTPVRSAENGIVAYVGNKIKGFGNLVLVRHAGGFVTAYAHNDKVTVRPGGYVKRGEVIASLGSSGAVDTPQLHFQVRRGKRPVDALQYLERLTPPAAAQVATVSRFSGIFDEFN